MARTVSRKIRNSIRRDRPISDRLTAQMEAWAKGKRTMVTIPNPNPNETNKKFIRVEGNSLSAFGPWKKQDKQDNKSDD